MMRRFVDAAWTAYWRFSADDGWAIASHITLSAIFALFPFLIFCASIAAFFDLGDFPETAVHLVFDIWPKGAAQALSAEILNVLTTPRGDLLTVGAAAALYFASNGVEAIRLGLNRAYKVVEKRHWLLLRAQSLLFVLVGSLVAAFVGFALVLAPLLMSLLYRHAPLVAEQVEAFAQWRLLVSAAMIIMALVAAHKWLPGKPQPLLQILPGLLMTLGLWIAAGQAFGFYLSSFANYVSTYAGLAGIMIAIFFVYLTSTIFLIGAEFNAALWPDGALTAKKS